MIYKHTYAHMSVVCTEFIHVVEYAGYRPFKLCTECFHAVSIAFGSSHYFRIESLQHPLKADIDNLPLETKLLKLGRAK